MYQSQGKIPAVSCAIYRSSSIGDVVLATACIQFLRELGCDYKVFWIGRQPSLDLISASFPEITPIEVRRNSDHSENLRSLLQIKHLHFIVDLQKTLRSRGLCWQLSKKLEAPIFSWTKNSWTRSRWVMQARVRPRHRTLPDAVVSPKQRQYEAMRQAMLEGMKYHCPLEMHHQLEKIAARPRLDFEQLSKNLSAPWEKELRFGSWLALSCGGAHPTKRVPTAKILEILELYQARAQEAGIENGLLIVGDQADKEASQELIAKLKWPYPVLDLTGKLPLAETACALHRSRAVLCNDSSIAHIAEALGVPVTVLFGPTIEGFGFHPHLPQSSAFSTRLGCRPCSKHGKIDCRFADMRCFMDIDARAIVEHLIHNMTVAEAE